MWTETSRATDFSDAALEDCESGRGGARCNLTRTVLGVLSNSVAASIMAPVPITMEIPSRDGELQVLQSGSQGRSTQAPN